MPKVPAHLCECALGMLQGGMRTADVAKAINCNVRTVRRLRQHYRETRRTADRPCSGRPRVTTSAQDRYIQKSHLRDRYRMATTTARVTPETPNPSISAQTLSLLRTEAGLRAYRPVVRWKSGVKSHYKNWQIWCSPWGGDALQYLMQLVATPDIDCYLCSGRHYSIYVSHPVELVQFMLHLLNLVMFIQIFTHVKFAENKLSWQWEDVYFFAEFISNHLYKLTSVPRGACHTFSFCTHSTPSHTSWAH
jgi:transposase